MKRCEFRSVEDALQIKALSDHAIRRRDQLRRESTLPPSPGTEIPPTLRRLAIVIFVIEILAALAVLCVLSIA